MRIRPFSLLTVCAAVALAGAASGSAAGPVFGVADDGGKYADDGGGNFFLLLTGAGLTSNRITVTWDPNDGNHGFTIREKGFLDRAVPIAAIRGVHLVFDVYPLYARTFEENTQHRVELFAEYLQLLARTYPSVKTFIVGNEPNQPRFHQPQFLRGRHGFRPVSGALWERILASAYDALKAVNPDITVVGLGLSPRGNDDPRAKNNISRSPVRFLDDLAAEYRRSKRTSPLMDALGFHPYPNSNNDPLTRGYRWPNAGIPNLGRIKQAIWDGFRGTAQPVFAESGAGPGLGLVLDEYGRQATVISSVARIYTGRENVRTISEGRQANMYAAVLRQIECDPAITGFYFFHLIDETNLDRFQSGLLRADWTKRPAYGAVQRTLAETGGQCAGALRTWRHTAAVAGADVSFEDGALSVRAAEDAIATAGIFPASLSSRKILDALAAPSASRRLAPRLLRAYRTIEVPLAVRSLPRGSYVQAVVLRALMNPERTFLAVSDPVSSGR